LRRGDSRLNCQLSRNFSRDQKRISYHIRSGDWFTFLGRVVRYEYLCEAGDKNDEQCKGFPHRIAIFTTF